MSLLGAEDFGEVGGPKLAKSTHLTSAWGSLGLCNGIAGAEGERVSGTWIGLPLTEGQGRRHKLNMTSTTEWNKVYCSGGLGTSRAGVAGVVKQAPAASSSNDCGVSAVENQAAEHLSTTGGRKGAPQTPKGALSDSGSSVQGGVRRASRRKRPRVFGSSDSAGQGARAGADSTSESEDGGTAHRGTQDRGTTYSRSSERNLPKLDDLRREVQTESTGGLGGAVMEAMREVERISSCSKNLKGNFVRALRIAARKTTAAVTELVQRSASAGEAQWLEAENAQLRSDLQAAKGELEELRRGRRREAPQAESAPAPATAATRLVEARRQLREEEGRSAARTRPVQPAGEQPQKPGAAAGGEEPQKIHEGSLHERLVRYMRQEMAAMEMRLIGILGAAEGGTPRERRAETSKAQGPGVRPAASSTAPPQPTAAPLKQAGDEWRVALSKAARRKSRKEQDRATLPGEMGGEKGAAKKKAKAAGSHPLPRAATTGPKKDGRSSGRRERSGPVLQRPPRTAAVTLTAAPGARMTYAQAMATAREKISLAEMGIEGVRPKMSRTGGLILEVRGPASREKAQRLAERMSGVLEGSGIRATRPTKTAELRMRGLEASVKPQEVAAAVAAIGGCPVEAVKVGEVAFSPTGRGAVWLRCPLDAAHRVVKMGRVVVGWCSASVEPLQTRPLQCFRCLELGHTRSGCTSATDRSGLCYRCGGSGHRASKCSAAPRCPLCSDLGRPAAHRLGAPSCAPRPSGRGSGTARAAARPSPTPPTPTTTAAAAGPGTSGEARPSESGPAREPAAAGGEPPAARSPDRTVGQCPMEEGMDLE